MQPTRMAVIKDILLMWLSDTHTCTNTYSYIHTSVYVDIHRMPYFITLHHDRYGSAQREKRINILKGRTLSNQSPWAMGIISTNGLDQEAVVITAERTSFVVLLLGAKAVTEIQPTGLYPPPPPLSRLWTCRFL